MASKIMEIFEETDRFLDREVAAHTNRIAEAIKKLEERIIRIYTINLPMEGDPVQAGIKRTKAKLLTGIQRRVIDEFEKIYGETIWSVTDDFPRIQRRIETELRGLKINPNFTETEQDVFDALRIQARNRFDQFGEDAKEQIVQSLYDNVLGGASYSTLVDSVKGALTGLESVVGTPLEAYAETHTQDAVMGFYATIQKIKADKAGFDTFLYYGDIIKTTRPFCIARVGKMFTRGQINAWNDLKWSGKKPGNIWTNRGGYN